MATHPAPSLQDPLAKRSHVETQPSSKDFVVKGLTLDMVKRARGSANECTTVPQLKDSGIVGPKRVVSWQVLGTSGQYSIQIKWPSDGEVKAVKDINVLCSCPDGINHGPGSVCKHAYACLQKMIDRDAEETAKANFRKAEEERIAKEKKREEGISRLKNGPLGTDMTRIIHGLKTISDIELRQLLLRKTETEESLKSLISVFSVEDFSAPAQKHCYRCGEDFDPNYKSICETPHKVESVEQLNKRSWGSEYQCGDCGKSWKDSSWGYYDEMITEETGPCYRGPHQEEPDDDEEDEDDEY